MIPAVIPGADYKWNELPPPPTHIELCPNCYGGSVLHAPEGSYCYTCENVFVKPLVIERKDWDKYPFKIELCKQGSLPGV